MSLLIPALSRRSARFPVCFPQSPGQTRCSLFSAVYHTTNFRLPQRPNAKTVTSSASRERQVRIMPARFWNRPWKQNMENMTQRDKQPAGEKIRRGSLRQAVLHHIYYRPVPVTDLFLLRTCSACDLTQSRAFPLACLRDTGPCPSSADARVLWPATPGQCGTLPRSFSDEAAL